MDREALAHKLATQAEADFRAGELDAAADGFIRAIGLAPTLKRLHNLATVRQQLGDHWAAEAGLRQALALEPANPRTRASLALSVLAQGRWAEGFPLYDAWREIDDPGRRPAPDVGVPRWSGEDLAGKRVVVWGEEGFGDQIMYARFAPLLAQAGAEVAWVTHPALVRLVRDGLGQHAVAIRPGLRVEGADLIVPTSRLPCVLMPRLGAPPAAPYLAPPAPNRIEGLRIGVVTRGNPGHDNDGHRSLPPEAAAALMALPGAVSLAPEDTGARDFWDTASVIMGLDLVISVDTAVAHLTGALGKPGLVLLPAIGCDWRWGMEGEASAWYPTLRLIRQETPGDWVGVVEAVRGAVG